MTGSKKMNKKAILLAQTGLAQTGLALIFLLSGVGSAAAQQPSPVSLMPPSSAPAAPAVSIDAPIPGTSAPTAMAPTATAPSTTTQTTTTTQAVPAINQAAPVMNQAVPAINQPAPAAAMPAPAPVISGVPAALTPVAPGAPAAPAPAAANTGTAAQPSAAELAVVKNAPAQNAMAPVTSASHGAGNSGLRVTDILTTPANVRPLPKEYLIVKKDHNANDVDARLTAARSALAQGNYQAALELFDDLYRKSPRDMRVTMGRAVALQKLGQTDEALEAYQVALRTDPRNIEALTNMLGLLKGRDAPTALKKLQQLRDLYPANAEVTAQLGMVYGMAGDYNNALKYLNMADALKPGNSTVLYNRAVAYDHMGKTTEAAELYRQILLLASDGALDQSFPLEVVRQRLAALR
jgi:Flp pilus assembly protein TadD